MVSKKDTSTKSSYGFGIPKVHFTGIVLDGGTDIPKSIDNPHIAHSAETKPQSNFASTGNKVSGNTALQGAANDEKSMSVDLTLIVKKPYDFSNPLSFLFKED